MNEEFYRRQAEASQEHDRQKLAQQKHATMETYNLEQQEAHSGHVPHPVGETEKAAPSLWQRIKKMLGMR